MLEQGLNPSRLLLSLDSFTGISTYQSSWRGEGLALFSGILSVGSGTGEGTGNGVGGREGGVPGVCPSLVFCYVIFISAIYLYFVYLYPPFSPSSLLLQPPPAHVPTSVPTPTPEPPPPPRGWRNCGR